MPCDTSDAVVGSLEFCHVSLYEKSEGVEGELCTGRKFDGAGNCIFGVGTVLLILVPVLNMGEIRPYVFNSQAAYDADNGPKELYLVKGATHVDMYDKEPFVSEAVIKLSEIFNKNLNNQ